MLATPLRHPRRTRAPDTAAHRPSSPRRPSPSAAAPGLATRTAHAHAHCHSAPNLKPSPIPPPARFASAPAQPALPCATFCQCRTRPLSHLEGATEGERGGLYAFRPSLGRSGDQCAGRSAARQRHRPRALTAEALPPPYILVPGDRLRLHTTQADGRWICLRGSRRGVGERCNSTSSVRTHDCVDCSSLANEDRVRSSEDREDRAREDRKIGSRSSEDRTRSSEDRKIAQEGPVRKHDAFKFVQGRSPRRPPLSYFPLICPLQ